MAQTTKYRSLSISLPAELVAKIDRAAKRNYQNRSDFIRESIVLRVIPPYTATPAEERAIKKGKAAYTRGEFVTLKDIEHEFGMAR
jgi:metal-responsive CopG/Arc/MetJ family transcriptional regulator